MVFTLYMCACRMLTLHNVFLNKRLSVQIEADPGKGFRTFYKFYMNSVM